MAMPNVTCLDERAKIGHIFTLSFLWFIIVKSMFKSISVLSTITCSSSIPSSTSMLRLQTLERNEDGNCTLVEEFILLGFSESPEQDPPLFAIFLTIYIVTLIGNLGMIILIRISAPLHTPMYFFLCSLSVADICYSSVITPRFLTGYKSISFDACFAQLYFFVALVCTECFLLATMAYDRYVAICNPLLYSTVMSQNICATLVAGSGFLGLTNAMLTVCFLSSLHFCDSNIIRHFFCDTPPLIALASDHYVTEMIISLLAGYTTLASLVIILLTYILILSTILKIRSAQGRRKAFSTCTSHLTAVSVFYGTLIFTYLRPNASYSLGQDQVASVFYTVVVPMLNPMIYSLRNKEVKEALIRVWHRKL
ncbi:olfactory receptor 8H1-like [Thamnophis elegans]|uniref:olfactory receptor 8H1-like n=1 Tax=Thamnophis elegans TaxID=35005 RepID=UPI0013765136|nr:olfactory receptor 8H1-like [Thamnophis elegans]